MATHVLSRRGFLGHVAGAYTAATLAPCAVTLITLETLIERHRIANKAWCEACEAQDAAPSDLNMRIESRMAEIDEFALRDLLRHRPQTVEECGRKLAYLTGEGGPWYLIPLNPEMWADLINPMLAGAA